MARPTGRVTCKWFLQNADRMQVTYQTVYCWWFWVTFNA